MRIHLENRSFRARLRRSRGFPQGQARRLAWVALLVLVLGTAACERSQGHQAHRRGTERLRQLQDELLRLYSAGKLRPVISQELPLSQLKQALQLVEERQAIGKIVLVPG